MALDTALIALGMVETHGLVAAIEAADAMVKAGNVVLIDQNDPDGSCVFLRDNLCSVNDAKPMQCRGFPHFWRTPSIEEYCEGWRKALDLPPLGHKAKHEGR